MRSRAEVVHTLLGLAVRLVRRVLHKSSTIDSGAFCGLWSEREASQTQRQIKELHITNHFQLIETETKIETNLGHENLRDANVVAVKER
jgi:hypothetical protein